MATTMTKGANAEQTNRRLLIGAVVLAALAAVLVFLVLSNAGGSGGDALAGGDLNVAVAAQDLKPGTKLTEGMLKSTTLPESAAIDGAISDASALVGLTVRYPITAGEQFTPSKVGQGADSDGIEAIIPTGKRAMAVDVTENTSVGGLIVAGDHVDVISVVQSTDAGSGTQTTHGITLLQNVEVLSVAQNAQTATARLDAEGNPINTEEGDIATPPEDTSADPSAKTVTLAVEAIDAPLLAAAQTQGTVYLSLRSLGDDATAELPSRELPTQ